jgi:RNA polymerase sigma factor (sigma-70 family)
MHGKSVDDDRDISATGSFDELCSAHATRAWGFASRLTQCSADADDVMQDAFVVAWRKRDLIPVEPWPWFCTVVSNCARNHRRKTGKVQRMASIESVAPEDSGEIPARAAEINELRTELVAALNELGPEEHQAVALCVLGGLTQAAASELTGTNLNTIKARVRRGLDRLREKLKNRPDSIEAFLALPVLPFPPDTLEGAVSRWSETAKGTESTGVLAGASLSKSVLLGCVLLLVVGTGLNIGFNLMDFGRESPAVGAVGPAGDGSDSGAPPADSTAVGGPLQPVDRKPAGSTPGEPDPGASFAIDPLPPERRPAGGAEQELMVTKKLYPSGELEVQGTALKTSGEPLNHGHFIAYYETGQMKAEYSYVRGALEGTWSAFYPDGRLSYRGEYAADRKHGFWTYYRADGTTETSGEYFDDNKVGTWTTFYPSGDHERLDHYVRGVLSGLRKEYDQSGALFQTTEYADNKKNGLQLEYDPASGSIVRETRFEAGQKHGLERLFDPVTHAVKSEQTYERGNSREQ